MSNDLTPRPTNIVGRLVSSPLVGRLVNLPPFSWLIRMISRRTVRRILKPGAAIASDPRRTTTETLSLTLVQIVQDVVEALGYMGAAVATYDQGDWLTVKALYVDPSVATTEQIEKWERQISEFTGRSVSFTNPQIARVHRYTPNDKDNLSLRAIENRKSLISDSLYDLLVPIVPASAIPIVEGIQQAVGVRQVISVPFYINAGEIVGNLFAGKKGIFTEQDIRTLEAFGHQAAAAIESERRRLQIKLLEDIIATIQSNLESEDVILNKITQAIVTEFGYVGAMIATLESDNSLPLRVFYIDPAVATEEQVHGWENQLSILLERPITLANPTAWRVYLNRLDYESNLSFRAARFGTAQISDELYDLFRPILPESARPIMQAIQKTMGICQVIAVPFFVEGTELVGNLFTATRSRRFTHGELDILKMFGQQAALGIRNARQYQLSEERREAAQIFARMAFSSAPYVHTLRNHIGFVKGQLQLMTLFNDLTPEDQQATLKLIPRVDERLKQAAEILDHLHEPWLQREDALCDVNLCVKRALEKVLPLKEQVNTSDTDISLNFLGGEEAPILLHLSLADDLPEIYTSHEMLTEAFRVILKNAVEAITENKNGAHELWLETRRDPANATGVEIRCRDTGIGIQPENLSRIFELRWTTKQSSMGFGLFWTRDFVEGINGQVIVESEVGSGTTFHLHLPAGKNRPVDAIIEQKPTANPNFTTHARA